MTRAEQIEAVARSLAAQLYRVDALDETTLALVVANRRDEAAEILDLVRPLVLEEAAAVCERVAREASENAKEHPMDRYDWYREEAAANECADEIRALAKIAT